MITVSMSTAIGAARSRVWRSFTRPNEIMSWGGGMVAPLEIPDGYPHPGQQALWRYRPGKVPIVLRDHPIEVIPNARLHSRVDLGLFHFDLTLTLAAAGARGSRSQLGIKIVAPNIIPLVGGALDRFAVRELAADLVDRSLKALKVHCESPTKRVRSRPPRRANPG